MDDGCVWVLVCGSLQPHGLLPTPHHALLSMGFSWREYWSGLPFPSPGGLPDPGTDPASPALAANFFTTEPPGTTHASLVMR